MSLNLSMLSLKELDSLSNRIISSNDISIYFDKIPQILNAIEQSETRDLAVSAIKHLYTRVKASPSNVFLPIGQLINLFIENKDKIFFRQFVKLFIQMENRWDEKENLLPIIFKGIYNDFKSSDDEDFIFRCFATRFTLEINQVREGKRINEEELDVEYVDSFKKEKIFIQHYFSFINENLKGKQKLLDFFTDILMFKYEDQNNGQSSPTFWKTKRRLIANTKDNISNSFLHDLKVSIFRLFESEAFDHDSVLIPIIIGISDYDHNIVSIAERTMKQLDIDYENQDTIINLMRLSLNEWGRPSTENEKRKALVLLRKSEKATRMFPQIRQVLFQSMLSNIASLTIRRLGFDLFNYMLEVSFYSNDPLHISEAQLIFNTMLDQLSSSSDQDSEHISILESLYISVGQLARRYPQFVNNDFQLVERYFSNLDKDPRTRQAIQQGIGSLMFAYLNPSPLIAQKFHNLFYNIIQNPKSTQYAITVVLQSANRLFNFDDIPSRFLNLLCIANSSTRVAEEARRGCSFSSFNKYRFKEQKDEVQKYPEFSDFIRYVFSNYNKYSISSPVHSEIMIFCRECLKESSKLQGISLHQFVSGIDNSILLQYIDILIHGFSETSTSESLLESANALLDIIIQRQDNFLISKLLSVYSIFQKCLFLGNDLSRKAISKIIALLFCFDSEENEDKTISFLKNNLIGPKIPEKNTYSSLQVLGFIAGLQAKKYYLKNSSRSLDLIKICIQNIIEVFENDSKESIDAAAIDSLGSFAFQSGFDLLEEEKPTKEDDSPTEKRRKLSVHKNSLLQILYTKLKEDKRSSIKESLISTLGMLALSEKNSSVLSEIRECLLTLSLERHEEIAFAVGESLSAVSGGKQYCTAFEDEFEKVFTIQNKIDTERSEQLKFTLQQIVRNGVLSGKRIVRQNAAVYMLCILQYASKMPTLQNYLYEIQEVFSILLSDTNEVTTEIAARGIALLYECSDDEHRSSLVDAIQSQLSGNEIDSRKKVKIMEDTDLNLFPPGSEPQNNKRAPKNYKELLDVAQDVGDPSIIYKLLSVSQHNQIWNTKKSAAFSVVSIINQTQDREKMQKILPQLVPKLYRYRHDPNHLISKSMHNMWNSLVEDSVKVVDQYLSDILKEISINLKSNQWRSRESSANALTEVISGRHFEEVKDYLLDLMVSIFRCCDDVKESSRKAANSTLLKLGEVTQRFCDIRKSKLESVNSALNILIPLYLKTGLVFIYKPIVYFSIEQLNRITKLSEHAIKPFAADICSTFLEFMSVFEDSSFSYLDQHRQRLNISQGQLDHLRVEMSKGGSIDDTIQLLVTRCDDTVLPELVPKLCNLIEHGVGLPTRAGVMRFIADVAKFQKRYFRSQSTYIIKAMMQALRNNKSPGERSQIASALPYVLNASTVNRCKSVLEDVLLFYDNGDEDDHLTAGVVLVMINRKVPLLITKFFDMLIPTIFVANFDPNEKVTIVWKELLEESVHTSETEIVRLHLEVILQKCLTMLKNSEWKTKQQSAKSLYRISQLLKGDIPQLTRLKVIQILFDSLQGRIWSGKEDVLLALGGFIAASKDTDVSNSELVQFVSNSISQLIKDCTKTNQEYRLSAFNALNLAMRQPIVQEHFCSPELATEMLKLSTEHIELENVEESKSKIQFGSHDDSEFMMNNIEKSKVEAIKLIGFLNQPNILQESSSIINSYLRARRTTPQTKAFILSAISLLKSIIGNNSNTDKTQKDIKLNISLSEIQQQISKDLINSILYQLDPQISPEKVRIFIIQEVEDIFTQYHKLIKYPTIENIEEKMQTETLSQLKSRYESIVTEWKNLLKQVNPIAPSTVSSKGLSSGQETLNDSLFGDNPFGSSSFGDNPFGGGGSFGDNPFG